VRNKLINIGILEVHYHLKFLHTTIKVCKTNETNLTIFTTRKIYERLKIYIENIEKYEFVIKEKNESISKFLKRVEKVCNEKIELLFINTIQTNSLDIVRFISFKPNSKIIATSHITNHWLKAKYGFNVKNIPRSLDVTISLFLLRKILLKRFNALNVIYPPVKAHIEKNTNYRKPVFTIPFNFYDNKKVKKPEKKDEKIRFIIPGYIEKFRRDYHLSLDVFEKLFEKYNEKIELYILGQPRGKYGKEIINKCKILKEKGYNIKYPTGFISEEKYNEILIESDIIFSPLQITKIADTGIKEIYGTTEGSAIPFEAIQSSKPLIIGNDFKIMKELESSTVKYKSREDLIEKIIDLIENKEKLKKIKIEAKKNSKNFMLPVLQEYFKNKILDKINEL